MSEIQGRESGEKESGEKRKLGNKNHQTHQIESSNQTSTGT
jgi:hypothetical protein